MENSHANRIVSLIPSATEWLFALGLGDRVVGVSHECDFPAAAGRLPKVTGSIIDGGRSSREIDDAVRRHAEEKTPLFRLDVARLVDLNPDLVVTQSLCNVCAVNEREVMSAVESLPTPARVFDMGGHSFEGVFADVRTLVELVGGRGEAAGSHGPREALSALQVRTEKVRRDSREVSGRRPRVTLLEWLDPLFSAGHWTPELIDWAGGCDPIGSVGKPSREISFTEVEESDPDLLLIACCGLPRPRAEREWESARLRSDWGSQRCVAAGNVHLFDGSAWFNRPGPRLVDALESVADLIRQWRG